MMKTMSRKLSLSLLALLFSGVLVLAGCGDDTGGGGGDTGMEQPPQDDTQQGGGGGGM